MQSEKALLCLWALWKLLSSDLCAAIITSSYWPVAGRLVRWRRGGDNADDDGGDLGRPVVNYRPPRGPRGPALYVFCCKK